MRLAALSAVVLTWTATAYAETASLKSAGINPAEIKKLADLYRGQIDRCWLPPVGQKGHVVMMVRYKVDGTLDGQPTAVKGKDGIVDERAVASATRALARCSPIRLPAEQFEYWKTMEITFSPH